MKNKIKLFIVSILVFLVALGLFACDSGTVTKSRADSSIVSSVSSSSSAKSSSSSKPVSKSSSAKSSSSSSSKAEEPVAKSHSLVLSKVGNGTLTATAGGKTLSSGANVTEGTEVTVEFTPSAEYMTTKLVISGGISLNKTYNTSEKQSYKFKMTANANVQVTFTQIEYSVSISGSGSGSVTADKTKAVKGASVKLTITQPTGCKLTSLIVDGTEKVNDVTSNSLTFTMPNKNISVTYVFANVNNITTGTVSNGTISVKNSAEANEVVTITVSPSSGYICEEVVVSYGSETQKLKVTDNMATFTMPNQAVTVTATFVATTAKEYVSHMILGDSYTDTYFWQDFYSDFSVVTAPKDIGIGGTQVPHWISGLSGTFEFNNATQDIRITDKYNVSNFVFHIGVNDIDGGTARDTVVSNLKTLFTNYHNAYPTAQIYWVSLSLNTMFATTHTADYLYVNSQIKSYMDSIDYLTYIDTCSVMFPDNQPNGDWFADGLHFNADGYDTWSALILNAVGYPKATVADFGQSGVYYSSSTYKANSDGTVSNAGATRGEQSIWFSGVTETNMYAELSVTVKELTNSDQYPKFGMSLKTSNNHVFFFVDAISGLTGSNVGVTYRTPVTLDGGYLASKNWDWNVNMWGTSTASYINGTYTKLGLLKVGSDLYFYVNGKVVNSINNTTGMDGASAIGFTVFNLNVTIKDYSVTTNVQTYIDNLTDVAKTRFDANSAYTIAGNSVTNTTASGESSAWATGINHSKFYFETEITLNSVIGTDLYPKAGITVNLQGVGTLLFYIDAVNGGSDNKIPFGTNAWVGYVYRPAGTDTTAWNWSQTNATYVQGLKYTSGNYAKLGLYKSGSRFIFTVNGNAVLDTSYYTQFAGQVNVGVMVFNLAYNAKNCGVVVSDKVVDRMFDTRNMADEITIDGNISDWSSYSGTVYTTNATDGSGVGYTARAFMGTKHIYVVYEIKSKTYNTSSTNWYENFNVEITLPNASGVQVQIHAGADYISQMVKSYALKSTKSGDIYTTIVEVAIPYASTENLTGQESSVKIGLACRPGNETGAGMCEGADGVWWTGANHAYTNPLSVTKNGLA